MANQFLSLLKNIHSIMNQMNHRKELMNISDLAHYTGWSQSYLYQLTSQRIIPFYKPIGKSLFFRRSEIDKWIFDHKVSTADELLNGYEENSRISKTTKAKSKLKTA